MSGSIEDVGARLVLKNRASFQSAVRATKADVANLAKTTTKANEAIAASYKATSDVQAEAAAKIKAASDAQAKAAEARRVAVAAEARGDVEAATAAKAHAAELSKLALVASAEARSARSAVSATQMETAALKSNARAADLSERSLSRHAATMGVLTKASGALVKGGLLVAAGAAYEGAKVFSSYQQALEAFHTQAGLTQGRTDALGKSILALTKSGQVAVSPTDAASMMFRIVSSTSKMGLTNAQDVDLLRASAGMVAIGGPGTDPEQTARVLAGVRATGIKGPKNPMRIAAMATSAVGTGDLRMSDLVNFISTGVLSSARLTGTSLPQVLALLATLGDNLQNGSTSGHALGHGLQLLAAPSGVGQNVNKAIGLGGMDIANTMRTQGLPAALALLDKHLSAPGMINPNRIIGHGLGAQTESQFLKTYGFSAADVKEAARVGLGAMGANGKSLMNDLLVREFGGAKQMVPIATAFTEQPRFAAALSHIQGTSSVPGFQGLVGSAMHEPANQLKVFDTELKTLEIQIGAHVLPKVISFGQWMERNTGLVKGLATAIGTLLIPATAIYIGSLANRGVTAVRDFSNWTGQATSGISKIGPAAKGQSAGLGVLGKSVMGVTAAIGVFELGKATAGHGAGGALVAGLGGAVTGMVVGFAVGGPFGAAVGAAGGALIGLAGHFLGVKKSVSGTNREVAGLVTNLTSALQIDKGLTGANTKGVIAQFLQGHPAAAKSLAGAGVTLPQIEQYLTSGGHAYSQQLVNLFAGRYGLSANGPVVNQAAVSAFNDLKLLLQAYNASIGTAGAINNILTGNATIGRAAGQVGRTRIHVPSFGGDVRSRALPHLTMPVHGGDGASHHSRHGTAGDAAFIHLTQNFNGQHDPKAVYEATRRGLADALARV